MITWKVVPSGDGSLYGWATFDESGKRLESGTQFYPSYADAEKVIRTIAPKTDTVEVTGLNNINPEANRNVNIVTPTNPSEDRFRGMTPVEKSIDEVASPEVKRGAKNGPNPLKQKTNKRASKASTKQISK